MTAPDTSAGLTALAEEAAIRLEQEARYLDVAEAAGDADTADYARDCLAVAALLRRLAAALAEARREGAAEMRERAAQLIECGCRNRRDVVTQRLNSAARRNLCEHPSCMAIEAAAIRALPVEDTNDD